MIEQPIYIGICKDFKQLSAALATLSGTTDDKFPVRITLEHYKKRRTDQQNRYLFGVVYAIISQETGNNVNDLHEFYLGEFFGWEEYEVMGLKRLRPRERSSKQVKARFSEFLESVISHAASLGIVVPPPNHDLPADLAHPQER